MDLNPNEVDKLLQAETNDADWDQVTREAKARETQESLLEVLTAAENLLADIKTRGLRDEATQTGVMDSIKRLLTDVRVLCDNPEKLRTVKGKFDVSDLKLRADEKLDDGKKRHKVDLPDNTMHGIVPTPGREM